MKLLYKILEFFRKLIFWLSISLLFIFCFGLTIGQGIPIEFRDRTMKDHFYEFLFLGFPICVFLTSLGLVKRKYSLARNLITLFYTVAGAVITFFIMMNLIFIVGFAEWFDTKILYRNSDNHNQVVREQLHDWGAFGQGGKRVVRLQPFLWYWYNVIPVDTTKIDTKKWVRVDERPYQ